ncbi:aromatic acid exporter family protein [Aquicella siphonis]|nr:FUSC family protein [Aquicella siphonis]
MDSIFTSTIRRFIYLVLVAFAACVLWRLFCHQEGYWLVWAVLLCSLVTQGDSFRQRLINIIITGLAAAFVVFGAGCIRDLPLLPGLYILIVTAVCVYISQQHAEYFLQAFIVNLFAVLASAMPASFADNAARLFFISAGMAVALVFQIIFYPYFIRDELRSYVIITLRSLERLNREIFSCFLDAEYSDNIYLYERRIHNAKNRYMQSINRLRDITGLVESRSSQGAVIIYQNILQTLDLLYDNMLDYSQLRRRVSDFTTLSLCSRELSEISQEIEKSIAGVAAHFANKKYYPGMDMLSRGIGRLESNYYNVLQVASREPLPFLFFMDSLQAFGKTMEVLFSIKWPSTEHYS